MSTTLSATLLVVAVAATWIVVVKVLHAREDRKLGPMWPSEKENRRNDLEVGRIVPDDPSDADRPKPGGRSGAEGRRV